MMRKVLILFEVIVNIVIHQCKCDTKFVAGNANDNSSNIRIILSLINEEKECCI